MNDIFYDFCKSISSDPGCVCTFEKDIITFGCKTEGLNLTPYIIRRPPNLIYNFLLDNKFQKKFINPAYTYIYKKLFVGQAFLKRPYVNIVLGKCDSNGIRINQSSQPPNKTTGEYRVYHPYPEQKLQDNEFIEKLLSILFPETKKKETIKKLLAQSYLEYRTQARPTVILFGERGSGKSLFFNLFYKQIFPSITTQLPPNFKDFNGFLKNTFIIAEESQDESVDLKTLGSLIKKWSGSSFVCINEKNEKAYDSPFAATFFIASNQKPIHLTELIKNDHNNQYLVVYFKKSLTDEIKALQAQYQITDLEKAVKDRIGFYTETELTTVYKQILEDRKKQHCRYGFPIPVDQDVLKLSELSETQIDTAASFLLHEKLWTVDQGEACESEALLNEYKTNCFLANQLILEACNAFKLNILTYNNIRNWLDKQGYKWETKSKKIGNKTYRGILIAKEFFHKVEPENRPAA